MRPACKYVPVDGELELLPGLRLVPAPGHTRGMQVVVVETGGRPVVVGGDVAVWFGELDEPHTEGQLRVRALDPELVCRVRAVAHRTAGIRDAPSPSLHPPLAVAMVSKASMATKGNTTAVATAANVMRMALRTRKELVGTDWVSLLAIMRDNTR